jgi:hypothetical protein
VTNLRSIIWIILFLIQYGLSYASEESTALLNKARQAWSAGESEAADRHALAAIKEDPNDLEARWFRIDRSLRNLINVYPTDRAVPLAAISTAFDKLADMAKKAKQSAFLHYITAFHAAYYLNYERAVAEIDRALLLDPKSSRFLLAKGKILARFSDWSRDDKRIEAGLQYLRQAAERANKDSNPDAEAVDYDFAIASAISDLSQPRWQEVAAHYERYLKSTPYRASAYTFAWNNLSIADRRLGECQKAKDAAEAVLKIRTFGAAEMNRNRAEFCLEMQKLGMANLTKNKR